MTRNFGLDFLRALAILMVMWSHSLTFLNGYAWAEMLHYKPFDGVDLFFVLSGYLIGGLMLKELAKPNSFSFRALGIFVCRRWLRTIPAYWLVLGCIACVGLLIPGFLAIKVDWLSFLFFTQNISQPLIGFFWESWSLAVEEWFYLFWPLAVYLFSKIMRAPRAYMLATAMMWLVSLCCRHAQFDPTINDFMFDVGVRKMVLLRWDGIAVGLILALLAKYEVSSAMRRVCFVLGLTALLLMSSFDLAPTLYFKHVPYFAVMAIALALIFPLVTQWTMRPNWFCQVATFISKISYGLYLVNLTLVVGLLERTQITQAPHGSMLAFALFWIGSFVLATMLYYGVERPILKWRDRHVV